MKPPALKAEIFGYGFSQAERRRVRKNFRVLATIFSAAALVLVYVLFGAFQRSRFFELTEDLQNRAEIASKDFSNAIDSELRRPFVEYALSNLPSIGLNNFLKISPLSRIPIDSSIPGLLGYFQVSPGKTFETPVLPAYGLRNIENLEQRVALSRTLFTVLTSAKPLSDKADDLEFYRSALEGLRAPIAPDASLLPAPVTKSGTPVAKLKLKEGFTKEAPLSKKSLSKLDLEEMEPSEDAAQNQIQSLSKAVALHPFRSLLLDSGHIVFLRNVFRGKSQIQQGFVVKQKEFFQGLFKYRNDPIRLSLVYQEKFLGVFADPAPESLILLRDSLPIPLGGVQYLFSAKGVSLSPQQRFLMACVALVLLIVLVALNVGYRTSLRQLDLFDAQNNFVSAVNHELRTPLTAIRMHSEMLAQGWVPTEERRQSAYGFILAESERLSRLIENVLRFSRMERESDRIKVERHAVASLMQSVLSRVQPLAERAGFTLEYVPPVDPHSSVTVDSDAFLQVMLNLADNALKFSRDAPEKRIVIRVTEVGEEFCISVRDFGPGIAKNLGNTVFDLFVRAEDEMTRNTSGTGIGLALVRKLLSQMNGRVEYANQSPGCEFLVFLSRS